MGVDPKSYFTPYYLHILVPYCTLENKMVDKGKFFKVYSNLPINLRKEIILVIDDEPLTWKVAYLEISEDTPLGKRILEKLEALELI